jgi:hypothetical protein
MIGIPYNGHAPNIMINKVANGWSLTLPVNIEEDEYGGYKKVLRGVAIEMSDRMKYDDDELLAKGKLKPEEKPEPPLIGYIPPIPNVFIFKTYQELLDFLKENVY